jgi:hypothetical protein
VFFYFVRFGSKTVLAALKCEFRSTPINGHHQTGPVGPVRARLGSGRPQQSGPLFSPWANASSA